MCIRDRFHENAVIPTEGDPTESLAGRYDIQKGTTTNIEYRFQKGEIFAFGLEGNWFSPKGATGTVEFKASVKKQ